VVDEAAVILVLLELWSIFRMVAHSSPLEGAKIVTRSCSPWGPVDHKNCALLRALLSQFVD